LVIGSATKNLPITGQALTQAEYTEYVNTLLGFYNALAQETLAYNVVLAEGTISECLLVLAGFEDASSADVEGFMQDADCAEYMGIDEARLSKLAQGLDILDGIEPAILNQWLANLKQALTEEHFDEEYNRLLSEGFDQYMEAVRLLLDLSEASVEELKEWLQGFVLMIDQQDPPGHAKTQQQAVRVILVRRFGENSEAVRIFDQHIVFQWDRLVRALGSMPDYFGDQRIAFTDAMYWIVIRMAETGASLPTLASFLGWMNTIPNIEQGLGTILSVGYAAAMGWQVLSFQSFEGDPTQGGRTGWAAELTLPRDRAAALNLSSLFGLRDGPGRVYTITGIHAVVFGSHCQNCTPQVNDIADWLFNAMRQYGSCFTKDCSPTGELNVFVVSFTNLGANGEEVKLPALWAGSFTAVATPC
jgi:hypothetical protein